jgi:hypothetical protein
VGPTGESGGGLTATRTVRVGQGRRLGRRGGELGRAPGGSRAPARPRGEGAGRLGRAPSWAARGGGGERSKRVSPFF